MPKKLVLAQSEDEIRKILIRQLSSLFSFDEPKESANLSEALSGALQDVHFCFLYCRNKYYSVNGQPSFNLFHSGQNSIFLYFISRRLQLGGFTSLADRVYFLNKALNGVDLYHEIQMPRVFFLEHPIGSVIGRGKIGDGFVAFQGCTVGDNKGQYPTLEPEVIMFAGSMILGRAHIGRRTLLQAGTIVINQDTPPLHIVSGRSPHLELRPIDDAKFENYSQFAPDLLRRL